MSAVNVAKRIYVDDDDHSWPIVTLLDCDGDETDIAELAVVVIAELDHGFVVLDLSEFDPVQMVH